jgi:hypothetical protein
MAKEQMKRKRHKGTIDNDRTEVKPQHSMNRVKSSKIELLEEYYNYNSQRLIPITKETLERLARNAEQWSINNDRAFKVKQFMVEQGIAETTWRRWCKICPRLKEANDNMKTVIGCRREVGVIERKYEPGSIIAMMPHYDDDWKDNAEWKSNLSKKEDDSKGGETFVVIEKYPDSHLVPEKKDE